MYRVIRNFFCRIVHRGWLEPDVGYRHALEGLSVWLLTFDYRSEPIVLTWSFEILDAPIFSAGRCALRALVPVAYSRSWWPRVRGRCACSA